MGTHTKTYTATLKTCRNGTSWRADFPKAGQGQSVDYDTAQRVGYIGFDCDFTNKIITEIQLTFTYDLAGWGASYEKTLGFYKWEGNLSPTKYTTSNLLGTYTSNNQHGYASKPLTITLNSGSSGSLFTAFKNYFESGNSVLIICRPNDTHVRTDGSGKKYGFTDNYLLITQATMKVTYKDTYNMDVNYKVNGIQEGYYSGYSAAGTFDATVGGTKVKDDGLDLNHRAVSGTAYEITANPASGWRLVNNGVNGTNKVVEGQYPEKDFSVVLDFRQEYTVTYNRGGGSGSPPGAQTKINGYSLALQPAISRSNSDAGSYTVTLVQQNGASNDSLTAKRTTSYEFKCWKSSYDDKNYPAGKTDYSVEADTTMTAVWISTTTTSPVELPIPVRAGYTFAGWADKSGRIVASPYKPLEDNETLTAMWEAQGLVMIDNGSTFIPHTIWIDNGTSWDQYMPYIDTGTEWVLYTG